jgi:APA family basic amino acid/polyamine antiporter
VAIAAAFFPVGQLADISNSGTLFAFFMVAIAVMVLRVKDPNRPRPFKTPASGRRADRDHRLRLPLFQPAAGIDPGAADLGRAGPGDLLRLRLPQEPRGSRPARRVHELDADAPPTGDARRAKTA